MPQNCHNALPSSPDGPIREMQKILKHTWNNLSNGKKIFLATVSFWLIYILERMDLY